MKTNQDYKNAALSALRGNWTPAVVAAILYLLILMLFETPNTLRAVSAADLQQRIVPSLTTGNYVSFLALLVLLPLGVGMANAFRALYEKSDGRLAYNMFKFSLDGYLHKLWGMFLMEVFVFLWMLLLVIPGIIKAFSYAMTPYILDEHPELSAYEAIQKSRVMMRGHKFDLFYLYLSFIGWFFLALLTCGIGFFWLIPYMQTSVAAFYYDLKIERGEAVIEAEVVR